jgi:hypothetical protein
MAYVYLADRSTCPNEHDPCDWTKPPRFHEDVMPVVTAFYEANRTGGPIPQLKGTIDLIFAREPVSGDRNAKPYEIFDRENFSQHWLIPQVIGFLYYNISWPLYVIRPKWSYLLNAHFEAHAEHEYMKFVAENPALEQEPFESMFREDYGRFASLADLFRQIGYDERCISWRVWPDSMSRGSSNANRGISARRIVQC